MPIMVFQSDKAATYASAEAMFQAHVVHTLAPWWERIEQSIDCNLLSEADDAAGIYAKFVGQGLLRGSMKDRSEYFAKALGAGGSPAWMTQDEVRKMEELNPLGGDASQLPVVTNAPTQEPSPDDVKRDERMDALMAKLAAPAAPDIHITLNQEPVSVDVRPPSVTVNVPEAKAVPAQAPNVQVDVHVPQGPAPIVENTVNVPEGKSIVNVTAQLPELVVTAKLPPRKSTSETVIERDGDGNIVRSSSQSTERDL
jgi:hypothetical protein